MEFRNDEKHCANPASLPTSSTKLSTPRVGQSSLWPKRFGHTIQFRRCQARRTSDVLGVRRPPHRDLESHETRGRIALLLGRMPPVPHGGSRRTSCPNGLGTPLGVRSHHSTTDVWSFWRIGMAQYRSVTFTRLDLLIFRKSEECLLSLKTKRAEPVNHLGDLHSVSDNGKFG